ncbi:hypothetical protein [Nocardioides panacihumi]|uniref:hypothetical protein n=1 Tax=Nocardioides panacihumi TaxID=400774 RepID=UPI0031CEDD08
MAVLAITALSLTRERVDTRREWTSVRATWLAALVIGGIAAWLIQDGLDLGRGTMLVPTVLGLFVVAGVGLGETVVRPPRPTGPRSASLAPRRVADYVPQALATAVAAMTALHLATLALTTATASTDDVGRAGRRVAAQCGDIGSAASPYPGSFYSVPLIALLGVIGVLTAAALMTVVRRPRGFAPDDMGDDVLRRRSATRVVAAAGAAVAASHAGVAFFAGAALHRMDCQDAWMAPVGSVLLASVPVALLLLGWSIGRIVTPGGLGRASLTRPAAAA